MLSITSQKLKQARKMLKAENQHWWVLSHPRINGSFESIENCPVVVIQQQATMRGDANVDHVCK